MSVSDPKPEHLAALRKYFGHSQFRPMQWKIIRSILEDRQDNCVVMATGYGKSLCYQYPAVYTNGLSIVVSPLISLMQDQVLALQMSNIPACYLGTAATSKTTSIEAIMNGTCRLLYVTPEWCSTEGGQNTLMEIRNHVQITLIAIDEAHCVSQWGFDFRSSYRHLGLFRTLLPGVPILAVTATATPQVRLDICTSLRLRNASITCTSFDRPNLYLAVSLKTKDIFADMQKILISHGFQYKFPGPTIIYCPTKAQTERVSAALNGHGIKCKVYHADLHLKVRQEVHEEFIKDMLPVVVATVAFGMGIDKPDVRCVIHYGAPKEIESYYQEIGRAGRDGLPSTCHVFYTQSDYALQKYFIDIVPTKSTGERFKEHKEQMARRLQQYLETRECRRKLILEHFSDITNNEPRTLKPNCCDNCTKMLNSGKDPNDMPQIKVTEEAQQLLKVFQLFNGRFGLLAPIKFFRGTSEPRIPKDYLAHELHGRGKHTSEAAWRALGHLCIREGLLEENACSAFRGQRMGKFPFKTIQITERGRQFIKEGENCGVKLIPSAEMEMLFRKKATLPVESEHKAYFDQFQNKKNPEKEKERRAALYNLLKNLREDLANEYKCAPQMIISNRMMYDLASEEPRTLLEMAKIDGFNEAKLETFGVKFLTVVNEFCSKESGPRGPRVKTSNIEYENDSDDNDFITDEIFNNLDKYPISVCTRYEQYTVQEYNGATANTAEISSAEDSGPVHSEETDTKQIAETGDSHDKPEPQAADMWGNISDELFESFPLDVMPEDETRKPTNEADGCESSSPSEFRSQESTSLTSSTSWVSSVEAVNSSSGNWGKRSGTSCGSTEENPSVVTPEGGGIKKRILPYWIKQQVAQPQMQKKLKKNSLFGKF